MSHQRKFAYANFFVSPTLLLCNSLASLADSNPWKLCRALANTLRVLASSLLVITGSINFNPKKRNTERCFFCVTKRDREFFLISKKRGQYVFAFCYLVTPIAFLIFASIGVAIALAFFAPSSRIASTSSRCD